MEKLNPTVRPRSVKQAACTVRKSSRASVPSAAYRPRTLAPSQAHAHKARKVTIDRRNGESVRTVIVNIPPVCQLQKVVTGNRPVLYRHAPHQAPAQIAHGGKLEDLRRARSGV